MAASLTILVKTKERNSELANVPRNKSVNQFPFELRPCGPLNADEDYLRLYGRAGGNTILFVGTGGCFRYVYAVEMEDEVHHPVC